MSHEDKNRQVHGPGGRPGASGGAPHRLAFLPDAYRVQACR
jgi:hypothetical protein